MNNVNTENENKAIARNLSHKFDYYLIALVFTILGLSIQTSSLSGEHFQYIFEFLAWLSLLVSGLVGLWRLEYIPVSYREYGQQQILEERLKDTDPIFEGVKKEDLEANIAEFKKQLPKLESSISLRYKIHRWAFVIGVVSLIVSRGLLGIDKIQVHPIKSAPSSSGSPIK